MWQTIKDIFDRSTRAQRWLILFIIPLIVLTFLAFNNLDSIGNVIIGTKRASFELEKKNYGDSLKTSFWHRFRAYKDKTDSIIDNQGATINQQDFTIDSLEDIIKDLQ